MSEDRRSVLKILTGILGGGAAGAVGLPSIRALIAPINVQTVSGTGQFVPVAPLEALPRDGSPLKVPVVVPEPKDAWAKLPPTQIGAIYLIRSGTEVIAYSTVCPHLGCGVDYSVDKRTFACPCHESAFRLDGSVDGGPSPRAMDRLDVRVRENRIEVRYQQFKQGAKEKIPA